MDAGVFTINLDEKFPQLSRPPIVEAVIHWQARAQQPFELEPLRVALAEKMPSYSHSVPIQRHRLTAQVSAVEDAPMVGYQHEDFTGLRLTSDDGCNIVQFKRDGLVFSRTKSYLHWEPFTAAAKAAWRTFVDLTAPVEVQRLGVRFINHIGAAVPATLHDYLRDPPTCPSNLPLKEFVYQSTFGVPAHPFGVRIIKVMQPSMPELQQSSGLFLDIDVYAINAIPNETAALDHALAQMRWLKNKVFFTLLTEKAVRSFG